MIHDEIYVKSHFKETKDLVKAISSEEIANWILNHGYFAEQNILPPCFHVSNFTLQSKLYNKNSNKLSKRQLINISYPKTKLTSRMFSIQHPFNYHDIVYYLKENWEEIVSHLFHEENKIYSYSFPIALTNILEKFISECFVKDKSTNEKKLKINFADKDDKKIREIKQVISLLFLIKRESEKLLCHVLSVTEQLYIVYGDDYKDLKFYLKSTIENEIYRSSSKGSTFETVWLIFFSRYLGLGISKDRLNELLEESNIEENLFYKSILNSKQEIFRDTDINLFKSPKHFKNDPEFTLAKYLDIFDRKDIE